MKIIDDYLLERYSRQIIINEIGIEGQKKIFDSSVIIVGCGGLGTSAGQYLSMSGVGSLTFIDNDKIVLSNLNRQTLFTDNDIGENKARALSRKIKKINRFSKISCIEKEVTSKNIDKLINTDSIVLDCTDNFETRFLINKFCHMHKKILVSAAIQNFDIQAFVLASWKDKKNPCYECVFQNTINDNQNSCDDMGIVAPVAGLGGVIQANLTLNLLLDLKKSYFKEFLLFDCINLNLRKIKVEKNHDCKICKNLSQS